MLTLQEIAIHINQTVLLTLINGKEKQGQLIEIDALNNSIRLLNDSNISSVLISMVGMIERIVLNNGSEKSAYIEHKEPNTTEKETIQAIVDTKPTVKQEELAGNEQVVSSSNIVKIETMFDTEIKNSILNVVQPIYPFVTPVEIKNANYGVKNEITQAWDWILNKCKGTHGKTMAILSNDDLIVIVDKLNKLVSYPEIQKSATLYGYLGYFNYQKRDLDAALNSYKKALPLGSKPQDLLNMAAIAIEKNDNLVALYALEKLFLHEHGGINLYEKAWYKFTDLIMLNKTFFLLKKVLNYSLRLLLKDEQVKIFQTVCYCLLKNKDIKIIETQIAQSLIHDANYKTLALDALLALPQQLNIEYTNIEKEISKKPTTTKTASFVTKTPATTQYPPYIKYKDLLKEARTTRDTTKDFDKAEKLFVEGIQKEKNPDIKARGVRDLASMLAQRVGDPARGIQAIEKYQDVISDSDLNLLYTFNYQLGEYKKAIEIQKRLLINTKRGDLRAVQYSQIATCFVKLGNYVEAEQNYKNAAKLNTLDFGITRNIALCIYQQGRVDDATKILNELVSKFEDIGAIKLLDAINEKIKNPNFPNHIIDMEGLSFGNIDTFIDFYMSTCDLTYVDKNRISKDGKYIGNEDEKRFDLNKLETTASTLRSRVAEQRSKIYLNAARILFDLDEKDNDFYRYLCRSFTSRGDNAVQDGNSIDTIKTYYLSSLKAYNSLYHDEKQVQVKEQDAINAVCRFLFAYLGKDKIPLTAGGINNLTINDITTVFIQHPNINILFDALCILFVRSPQYSMDKVLKILFEQEGIKQKACNYLAFTTDNLNYSFFTEKWKDKTKEIIRTENELSNQLGILRNLQIGEGWLSSSIERIDNIMPKTLFDSDKDYLKELKDLLTLCISLCRASSFDEKNNKCDDIEQKTNNLIDRIKKNPTKLAVEEIYPIVIILLSVINNYTKEVYEKNKPELNFVSVFPTYALRDNAQIEIQIKIKNTAEGHAEQVELHITENTNYYHIINRKALIFSAIRGNEQKIAILHLQLTEKAITEKAFSLPVYATFKIRRGDDLQSNIQLLPVELGNREDFIGIVPNPYTSGATGRPITNENMFFGRTDYINKAYETLCTEGISYVIFGQFRSGKSSIRLQLEKKLAENPQIMIAKMDASTTMGDDTSISLIYRFLHGILRAIGKCIREKERSGFPSIVINIPDAATFYAHVSPLDYFYEILEEYSYKKENSDSWKSIRLILTIEEFTHLYGKIIKGDIDGDFMKNWKALLEANYFNVVLVAQDVFPKFFRQYENAFGAIRVKRITYLDEESAKRLIDEPIRVNGESRYRENAILRIWQLTAGHPWYIQILCNAIVEFINNTKQMYITEANIDIIKENLIRGDNSFDNYKNFIEIGDMSEDVIPKSDFVQVLKTIAVHTKRDDNGYCPIGSITCETATPIEQILKDLDDRDVIEKHGERGYRIRVGLFKEWLNENTNTWINE